MPVKLHSNATTTPRVRREIQKAEDSNAEIACRFNIGLNTVKRWRSRDSVEDRSSRVCRLPTTLSPEQELIVLELRVALLLCLDDLLRVTREYVHPAASRAALHRLLKRENLGNLKNLIPVPEKKKPRTVEDYPPGYLHIDIKHLPKLPWGLLPQVPLRRNRSRHAVGTHPCLRRQIRRQRRRLPPTRRHGLPLPHPQDPYRQREGVHRPVQPHRTAQATGNHPFDRVCSGIEAEHPPHNLFKPQTNGMVQRFNGRVSQIIRTQSFKSSQHLEESLNVYLGTYVNHIAQKALSAKTPLRDYTRRFPPSASPLQFQAQPSVTRQTCHQS